MTRRYNRPKSFGGGDISFSVYPGDNRSFSVSDGNTVKTVSVRDVSGYVFKLNKTCISANGGASALYEYVDKCLREKFCECYAWEILNHALSVGK